YNGPDPDGFMTRNGIIAYIERYIERFHLPVRYGVRVERVERNETSELYLVWTSDGNPIIARNVVIATGLWRPRCPRSVRRWHQISGKFTLTPTAIRLSSCRVPCWLWGAPNPGRRLPRNSMRLARRSISPLAAPVACPGAIGARTPTGGRKSSVFMIGPWISSPRRGLSLRV